MTTQHPATEPIVQIIGPHLTRDCARELADSIVENLLATGWLQSADLTMPDIVARHVAPTSAAIPAGSASTLPALARE